MVDKNLNRRLTEAVRNYNLKIERARKAGVPKNRLPVPVQASDIRESLVLSRNIEKEIKRLEKFSRASTEKVKLGKNVYGALWMKEYFKNNRTQAINYYESELRRLNKRAKKFPGESGYSDTVKAKLDVLNKNIDEMDEHEFKAGIRAIEKFIEVPSLRKTQYREYLEVVDKLMDTLGYSEKVKDEFFKKFQVLTPTQFLYMYDETDLIARIYNLYQGRDDDGEIVLNTGTADEAKELMDLLLQDVDYYILDALKNAD